ncbi:hypothetical protein F5B19DRAFT_201257 [Rostrohypoxylon terebratum]|nr:hypothetical protein F5B19DRAFT_201257 [Rostrohypoxylon terebratum]
MASSSSHVSGSHTSRSIIDEPKRRKRYSVRIEVLDDDDNMETDGRRESTHRQRRSSQGPPSPQRKSAANQRERSGTGHHSRRTSMSSTSAVVGSVDRNSGPPSTPARPPSAREQRERTGSHASPTNQRRESRASTVDELSKDFNRRLSVKDHSDADLPTRFQTQMSLHDHTSASASPLPIPQRPKPKKPARKHANTQTDLQGLGWSKLNLSTTPTAFTHTPHRGHPEQCQRNIEAAYRQGVEEGQRLVASEHRIDAGSTPLISPVRARSTTTSWPAFSSSPRPIPRQATPIPSARNQRAFHRAGGHEKQEQSGQKSWCPKLFSRGRETEPSRGRDREPR